MSLEFNFLILYEGEEIATTYNCDDANYQVQLEIRDSQYGMHCVVIDVMDYKLLSKERIMP